MNCIVCQWMVALEASLLTSGKEATALMNSLADSNRKLFLDEPTIIALERNEQEASLRMAGIENLASCPFCPYAAEYPPINIDREFRCEAPDCEKTSCRLCKLESHIPKSCEEHKKDLGLSVRRQIEEAMSAALIRKCNKCGTPFVKEEGCNKMTCTRNGCRNIQCYVCSKSCEYNHFDDSRRGGKKGNCPLFEDVEYRHENDVKRAEKEALDKVRAEHPEYTNEDLLVKMSEDVKKDDEQRLQRKGLFFRQLHDRLGQYPFISSTSKLQLGATVLYLEAVFFLFISAHLISIIIFCF